MQTQTNFDWADLAFANKKPLRELKATFIAAPREISRKRLRQLIKEYLPKGNVVLGISKEPFVEGFESQPQFRTLTYLDVAPIISEINAKLNVSKSVNAIFTLSYFQRELPYILEKITFSHVVLVNGSWRHVFHVSPSYYVLSAKRISYDMVSPFTDELEAREYEQRVDEEIAERIGEFAQFRGKQAVYSEEEMIEFAKLSSLFSYDYSFQAGLCLAKSVKNKPGKYKFIIRSYNKVVPFQTYAMLNGAAREKNFSAPHDNSHYDTVHAEVGLLIKTLEERLKVKPNPDANLHDKSLFINLMPCPSCARMLSQTGLKEIIYQHDHSDGYAVKLLSESGINIRRMVP